MPDGRGSPTGMIARLDRRQLVSSVTGGALLGSAWAASLRDTAMAGGEVHVTVARTATALGALVEHRGHRILLIDAADAPAASMVTELSTGFLRQRIDAVLLPAAGGNALPRDFVERWRVRSVWTLPEWPATEASSLAGQTLRVGDLAIDADVLPVGAWQADAPRDSAWYVAATFGRARVVITRDGTALDRLPLDPALANAVVCFDVDLELGSMPAGIDVLALPTEAVDRVPAGLQTVTLSRDASVAFRLRADRIETS